MSYPDISARFPHRSNPEFAFYPERFEKQEREYRAAVISGYAENNIRNTIENDIDNVRKPWAKRCLGKIASCFVAFIAITFIALSILILMPLFL